MARMRGVSSCRTGSARLTAFFDQGDFPYPAWVWFCCLLTATLAAPKWLILDLISGMLIAIRDFVDHSFGHLPTKDKELDEIKYGDERIIIQSGRAAYLAVVITGYRIRRVPRQTAHLCVPTARKIRENLWRSTTATRPLLPNLTAKDRAPGG